MPPALGLRVEGEQVALRMPEAPSGGAPTRVSSLASGSFRLQEGFGEFKYFGRAGSSLLSDARSFFDSTFRSLHKLDMRLRFRGNNVGGSLPLQDKLEADAGPATR